MVTNIIIFIMLVLAIYYLCISRNGSKIKSKDEPRQYVWIVAFRNKYYYDLLKDERFTVIGKIEKFNANSFIIKNVYMDDKELRKYICKTLETDLRNVNIVQSRWRVENALNNHRVKVK